MKLTEEVVAQAKQVFTPNYRQFPLVLERGEGCVVYDAEGKRYLDFIGGIAVSILGHAHPRLLQAAHAQIDRIWHSSNLFYNEPSVRLAALLEKHSGLERTLLCNSGTEANEAALKIARVHAYTRGEKERTEFVVIEGSFHGRSYGSLSATAQEKYHKGFGPMLPGFRVVPFGDQAALKKAVDAKVCAVLLEPILGEGGIRPHPPGYLTAARAITREAGALLMLDEIQGGLGRTGRFFSYEHEFASGSRAWLPDVVTVAKGLAGGLPIGAMLTTQAVAQCLTPGTHGTTFGGNPVCAAVACEVLEIVGEPEFLTRVAHRGKLLREGLQSALGKHPRVKEIRGQGLMLAIELTLDNRAVTESCIKEGLLVNALGQNCLRLLPALTISEEQVREGVELLRRVLEQFRESKPTA